LPRDTRRRFQDALKKQSDAIFLAYTEAVANLHNAASLRRLEAAIDAGDIGRVLAILGLDEAAFDGVQRAIRETFDAGAAYQIGLAPKPLVRGLTVDFQGYHPRITDWMDRNAAVRVAELAEDARSVVRETITRGMREQRGYKRIAVDLVGRMDGNTRRGGVIGLLDREAGYVANARDQLENLDPAYFERKLRDKRFDRTIARAIREGTPLPDDVIENATSRYSARMLRERGRRISRTEGNRAMNAGRTEAVDQMIGRGDAEAGDIIKTWRHTARTGQRDNHAALNGQERAWGEPFSNGLQYPHEEGAPASEVVSCGCHMHTVTRWENIARRRGTL